MTLRHGDPRSLSRGGAHALPGVAFGLSSPVGFRSEVARRPADSLQPTATWSAPRFDAVVELHDAGRADIGGGENDGGIAASAIAVSGGALIVPARGQALGARGVVGRKTCRSSGDIMHRRGGVVGHEDVTSTLSDGHTLTTECIVFASRYQADLTRVAESASVVHRVSLTDGFPTCQQASGRPGWALRDRLPFDPGLRAVLQVQRLRLPRIGSHRRHGDDAMTSDRPKPFAFGSAKVSCCPCRPCAGSAYRREDRPRDRHGYVQE